MDTKTAVAKATPSVEMPKFNIDGFVAMQRANLDTMAAAQKIMLDLAQTFGQRQAEMARGALDRLEGMVKGFDGKKQPGAYVEEIKVAVEKAMVEAKETMDLGMKAQTEVVDLLVNRASKNFQDAKSLAA